MAFCTRCGADVTGKRFCVQCGTPVSGTAPAQDAAPPAGAPFTGTPSPAPSAPPPPKTTVSPVVWVLAGIVGFFVLIGILIAAGGLFVAHKVKQHPALAMAKLLTATNPDVEVVSSDEGRNTVTFRDKKTGETVTMNFDDIKNGKIVFKSKGQEATIQARGDGQSGTLEVNGPQGSMKIGAGGKAPDWVPAYPGSSPQTTFSMQSTEGESGSLVFTTKDAPKNVLSFYDENLKKSGFRITANFSGDAAAASGGMLSAEDQGSKRTVVVTVGTEGSGSTVSLMFATKK